MTARPGPPGAASAIGGRPVLGLRFSPIGNDTPARVYYRVKMWQGDFSFVQAGKELRVEIPEKVGNLKSVQVEARSGEQWDNCFATVQVGSKLVVTQGRERINCKVER